MVEICFSMGTCRTHRYHKQKLYFLLSNYILHIHTVRITFRMKVFFTVLKLEIQCIYIYYMKHRVISPPAEGARFPVTNVIPSFKEVLMTKKRPTPHNDTLIGQEIMDATGLF